MQDAGRLRDGSLPVGTIEGRGARDAERQRCGRVPRLVDPRAGDRLLAKKAVAVLPADVDQSKVVLHVPGLDVGRIGDKKTEAPGRLKPFATQDGRDDAPKNASADPWL